MSRAKKTLQTVVLSDERIIELYWQREERAIRETDRKYGQMLLRLGYGILHDRCDSEECRNDTYLGVWKAVPPARPAVFPAFLSGIMRRIAINRYKEKTCKKRIPSELTMAIEDLGEALPSETTVQTELEAKELGRHISDYVRGLPERKQYLFVGRYYMARSVKGLAKELGLTGSAVYKELDKIKQGLKQHLESKGVIV